jgi:glycosyltransferase involved in cell wall biosynthesis
MANSVGIDAFNLAMPKGSGIATYAYNLNSGIRELGLETHILYGPEQDPGSDNLINEITLFDAPPPPSASRRWLSAIRNLRRASSPSERRAKRVALSGAVITRQIARRAPVCSEVWATGNVFHVANQVYGARSKFTQLSFDDSDGAGPDVMHWTCPLPIRATSRPNIYTIHDLVPVRLPFATLDNKRRFVGLCREICATADAIVTVSEHSKRDIIRFLGVDEKRIAVTHQAVDMPREMLDRDEAAVAREVEGVFGLDWRGYFLFFGAIEPKKNLARIIEAYLASGVSAPLIVIGGRAWLDEDQVALMYPDIVELSEARDGVTRRADRIRRYEYLPFTLLVSLIRGARATLLPSLYEGFGLPVLESMLLGTPVITSTEGSLPEIAGDAALLVDPYDTHAIRRAIVTLDEDADLRADLARRGVGQAAKFSSAAYREKLAGLYRPFV